MVMNTEDMHYEDICVTLREELEDAFEIYFNENLKHLYMMGVWEDDVIPLEEAEKEALEFMEDYLMERLQDNL